MLRRFLALGALLAVVSCGYSPAPDLMQMDVGSQSAGTPSPLSGCNGVRIDSAADCGGTQGFRVYGYNVLTLIFQYTRSSGTSITFNVNCTNFPNPTSSDWFLVHAGSIAAGVDTLSPLVPTKAVTASINFPYHVGINYQRCRVEDVTAAGGGAGDTAKVFATLGVLPAL